MGRGVEEGGTLGYSTASIDDRSAGGSLERLGFWAEEDREGHYRTQYLGIKGWLESLQGEYLEVKGYIFKNGASVWAVLSKGVGGWVQAKGTMTV